MEEFVPRQERRKRREKANKVKRVIFSGFFCFVAIFVIIWLGGSVKRFVNWNTMQLEPVRYGVLEDQNEKEAVVIRKESAYTVPTADVKFLVKEAQRVHLGAQLYKIKSAEIDRIEKRSGHIKYAPCSGTVSMSIDGLESVLTPISIFSLDLESVYKKVTKGTMEGQEKNQLAVKIVDNLSPAYLCFPCSGLSLNQGNRIEFRISGSKELFSGRVANKPETIALVKMAAVPKGLISDRICSIEVVTRREEGLIVPSSGLVKKDGKTGVYAVAGKHVQWTVVNVKGVYKENAIVTGLETGQEVVVNPETM